MTYITVILLVGFSVFSFAVDEKEMLERAEKGGVKDAEYEEFMRLYIEDLLKKVETTNDVEAMRELYESYVELERVKEAELWLNKLKEIADKGSVQALTIVYRATGSILSSGVHAAVGSALHSIVSDTGLGPKMVAMQNAKSIRNNIIREITAPIPNRCAPAF